MRRVLVFLFVSFELYVLSCGSGVCRAELEWQEFSRGILDVRAVLKHPDNNAILIGTEKGFYISIDGGNNWRNGILNKAVNFLLIEPRSKDSIFAATNEGLYFSPDRGKNWKKIFKGRNSFEKNCDVAAFSSAGLLLGTRQGLFVSQDKGRSWYKETGRLGNSQILAIATNARDPDYIYVASVEGVFKSSDSGKTWERIFVATLSENGGGQEYQDEDMDEEERFSNIRDLCIDPDNPSKLYLATDKGVYYSSDKGTSWNALSDYGLLSQDISFITIPEMSGLHAVTKSGIFKYENGRWHELSINLEAGEIESLALDNQGTIYAACQKGLFKSNRVSINNSGQNEMLSTYSRGEPKISEVQQAAIKYAEVEPEKIIRWRKQAAKRALLPKLTFAMDRDIDKTTSRNIWGTYGTSTTPGKHYIGPDDLTRYDNSNLAVALTWELGDLIWSNDQTSIDTRSRLMVQLRDDILDEVNKIYFERLRVKIEISNLSIEDRKKRAEKELRIEELTASLDALTGGYFSLHINTGT